MRRHSHGSALNRMMTSLGRLKNSWVLVLAPALLIALAAGIYWGIEARNAAMPRSTEFTGVLEGMGENFLVLHGTYLVDGNPYSGKEATTTVVITPKTRFQALVFRRPAQADIAAAGGVFDPVQETREGSLREIAGVFGDPVTVMAADEMFGQDQFQAAVVTYRIVDHSND